VKTYKKEEGIVVFIQSGETTENLIRRFKKKYSKSGIPKETRDRMQYLKPSIARKIKHEAARRLRKREEDKRMKKMSRLLRDKRKSYDEEEK
jgi:small subunit ribosomal protein S21